MLQRTLVTTVIMSALSLWGGLALAADQKPNQQAAQMQAQEQEQIFISQLMTKEEQAKYRDKMRAAKTPEERKKICEKQYERMKKRAKKRGVTLPDESPVRGMDPGDRDR